jgi:hypothetical protein
MATVRFAALYGLDSNTAPRSVKCQQRTFVLPGASGYHFGTTEFIVLYAILNVGAIADRASRERKATSHKNVKIHYRQQPDFFKGGLHRDRSSPD